MTAAAEIALCFLAVDDPAAAAALLALPEQALADPSVRRLRRALLKFKEDRISPTPALLKAAAPEAVARILTEGDVLKSWNDSPADLALTIRTQAALRLARDVYDAGLKGELSPLEAAAKLKELSAPPPGVVDLQAASAAAVFSEAALNEPEPPAIQTWPDLDRATGGGLELGTVTIKAAGPATGKTTLAVNVTLAARLEGRPAPTAFFSLEMNRRAIRRLFLAVESGLGRSAIRAGAQALTPENQTRLQEARERLAARRLWIFDSVRALAGLEVAVQAAAAAGARLCVVDYVGLIQTGLEEEYGAVGLIAERLPALAAETGVAILALCQVRKPDRLRDGETWIPTLWDLKNNSALAASAQNVLTLGQEAYEDGARPEDCRLICRVAKAKEGPAGLLKFHFQKWCGRVTPETGGVE